MNTAALCSLVTPDMISQLAVELGIPNLGRYAVQLRNALCGDVAAAATIEAVASKAPGCKCRGAAVDAVRARVSDVARNGWAAMPAALSPPIMGGGTYKIGKTEVGQSTSCDWMCRCNGGDLDSCELGQIASVQYPKFTGAFGSIESTFATATDGTGLGLPAPAAGNIWYGRTFRMGELKTSRVCQELCLNFFSFTSPVPATVTPANLYLSGETLVDDGENGCAHAIDYFQAIPESGYEITALRCRCVDEICLRIPFQGKLFVFVEMPYLGTVTAVYTGALEFKRQSVNVPPSPADCLLTKRCKRYLLSPSPCDTPTFPPYVEPA